MSAVALAALGCGAAVLARGGPAARAVADGAVVGRGRAAAAPAAPDGLSEVLHAVAARLRAGAEPGAAWAVALGGRPMTDDALASALAAAALRPRRSGSGVLRCARGIRGRAPARDVRAVRRAHAAVAAVRVANELGAPLAPALERIARATALDEEDEADVGAAIAGPRATARLLGWLPLLGLLVAAVLGADPVRVVVGGGLGTVAAAAGVALTVLGRWWTALLVRRVAAGGGG
jgi:tight adherence protein B